MDKAIRLFKIISWLDSNRWKSITNSNFINFCEEVDQNIDFDVMLLTHWLCYIVDRQMKFEKIWKEGGYVYSKIAKEFIKKKRKTSNLFKDYLKGNGVYFEYKKQFKSRFGKEDVRYIKQTLRILENYNNSFLQFIKLNLDRYNDKFDLVLRLALALFLLTYKIKKNVDLTNDNYTILINRELFEKELERFKKQTNNNKKRLWCALRDYLKPGSYFNKLLKKGLPKYKRLIEKIGKEQLGQLELPGDVWNNNSTFKKALIQPVLENYSNNKPSEILRNFYNKHNQKIDFNFYPEQFDLTFDFVPRMCEHPNNKISNGVLCDICPFGSGDYKKFCHQNKKLNCPIIMYTCGYISKCDPTNCPIKDNIGKGLCKTINYHLQ